MFHMGTSLRTGIFIPVELLNNPLASFSLKNFNFLLLYTEHSSKSIIFPCLDLTTLELLLSVFFLYSKQ